MRPGPREAWEELEAAEGTDLLDCDVRRGAGWIVGHGGRVVRVAAATVEELGPNVLDGIGSTRSLDRARADVAPDGSLWVAVDSAAVSRWDGGSSALEYPLGHPPHGNDRINDIAACDDGRVWAFAELGRVAVRHDGGWREVASVTEEDLRAGACAEDGGYVAAGHHGIVVRGDVDGGSYLQRRKLASPGWWWSDLALDGDRVWVRTLYDRAAVWDGAEWTYFDSLPVTRWQVVPSRSRGVLARGDRAWFGVGGGARVAVWSGDAWDASDLPPGGPEDDSVASLFDADGALSVLSARGLIYRQAPDGSWVEHQRSILTNAHDAVVVGGETVVVGEYGMLVSHPAE